MAALLLVYISFVLSVYGFSVKVVEFEHTKLVIGDINPDIEDTNGECYQLEHGKLVFPEEKKSAKKSAIHIRLDAEKPTWSTLHFAGVKETSPGKPDILKFHGDKGENHLLRMTDFLECLEEKRVKVSVWPKNGEGAPRQVVISQSQVPGIVGKDPPVVKWLNPGPGLVFADSQKAYDKNVRTYVRAGHKIHINVDGVWNLFIMGDPTLIRENNIVVDGYMIFIDEQTPLTYLIWRLNDFRNNYKADNIILPVSEYSPRNGEAEAMVAMFGDEGYYDNDAYGEEEEEDDYDYDYDERDYNLLRMIRLAKRLGVLKQ